MDWKQILPFFEAELGRAMRLWKAWHANREMPTIFKSYVWFIMDSAFIEIRWLTQVHRDDDLYIDTFERYGNLRLLKYMEDSGLVEHCTLILLFKIRDNVELNNELFQFLVEIVVARIQSIAPTEYHEVNESSIIEESHECALNAAPAQDSPSHILNLLNDDCIAEIFIRLDNFVDFNNAAKVCRRFEDLAKSNFPYKTFRIVEYEETCLVSFLNQLESFLHRFGQRITSIEWEVDRFWDPTFDENTGILEAIAHFCGQSLLNLKIIGLLNIDIQSHVLSQFKMLETLELYHVKFEYFVSLSLPKLKCLKLGDMHNQKFGWLSQTFIELKEIHLIFVTNAHRTVACSEIAIFKFLRLNPQLKHLEMSNHSSWGPLTQELIQWCPPKLETLYLKCVPVNLKKFNGRSIKRLYIPSINFNQSELNALLAANLSIEELEITPTSVDFAEDISRLRRLKKLSIRMTKLSHLDAIHIIKKLPLLNHLIVSSGKLSLYDVKQIIQHVKILGMLTLRLEWINIDTKDYFSILNLTKSRSVPLKLYVDCWTGRVDVEKDILQSNRTWLDIQSKLVIP